MNRRTIPPQAVLDALKELEFTEFLPRVEAELEKFTQDKMAKRSEYRQKMKDKEGGDAEPAEEDTQNPSNLANGHHEDEPVAKRPRVDESAISLEDAPEEDDKPANDDDESDHEIADAEDQEEEVPESDATVSAESADEEDKENRRRQGQQLYSRQDGPLQSDESDGVLDD